MLNSSFTKETFISEVITKLYDAGFDNSVYSNIRKIIEVIISDEVFSTIKESVNSLNFSSMEGEDLDYLFGTLFGIPRFSQTLLENQSLFTFCFTNKINSPLFFDIGTRFIYNGEHYIVSENKKLIAGDGTETTNIYCKKNTANINFDKTIICGPVTFNYDSKIYSENFGYETIKAIMESDLNYIGQTNKGDQIETDVEYRARASKIFQNFGYNNIHLIVDKISSIYGVKSVDYKEHDFFTEIFIIPTNLSMLNTIISTAQEICDYYKISSIKLRKPPVVNFIIKGLSDSFYGSDLNDELKTKIKSYISDLPNNDNIFNRDNFENFLYDYGSSKNKYFTLNETSIEIIYEVYGENDYIDQQDATPILSKKIALNKSKQFNGVIYTCGDIS